MLLELLLQVLPPVLPAHPPPVTVQERPAEPVNARTPERPLLREPADTVEGPPTTAR